MFPDPRVWITLTYEECIDWWAKEVYGLADYEIDGWTRECIKGSFIFNVTYIRTFVRYIFISFVDSFKRFL